MNLLALTLDFLLLLLHLLLGLRVGVLRILHRIADCIASATAQKTTDRSTRQRMAYGRSDNCTTNRTNPRATESAFLTSRERLPRASCKNK
ncbi:MAG: hypothetical protein ABSD51_03340, partial [Candidatus Binatus sp.]